MKRDTAQRVRRAIQSRPRGKPFASVEFLGLGTRPAVDHALSRFARNGFITRLAHGLYVRPRVSPYIGTITPLPEAILEAVARKTGERIQVSGAKAAAELGLTTQHPLVTPFETTGPSRRLMAGGREIALGHASVRRMTLAGRPAALGLAALWHLGPKRVSAATLARIEEALAPAEFKALVRVMPVQPQWLAAAFRSYQEARSHA